MLQRNVSIDSAARFSTPKHLDSKFKYKKRKCLAVQAKLDFVSLLLGQLSEGHGFQ